MIALKPHDKIRVFEGFAGYGGATFGLRRAGINFEVVGYSEFDKFASALYDANHKDADGNPIKNWGDITQIVAEDLPDFDLFTGGFPCQPFSTVLSGDFRQKAGFCRICPEAHPSYLPGLPESQRMRSSYTYPASALH